MKTIQLIIFASVILTIQSTLTLQQYPQYETQTPEVIFHQIQQSQQQLHPTVSKLVFITPWNSEGKRLTIKYANKIKYVSPCWYQLIVKGNKIAFENQQLADQQYIAQIKQANPDIKIIPRVYANNFDVFRMLGANQENFKNAVFKILSIIQKHKFDGIVWDSPYNFFTKDKNAAPLNRLILQFTNNIKMMFQRQYQANNKKLLLFFNMANPSNRQIDNSLYTQLKIDGLLIQNYDSPLDFILMIKNSVKWVHQVKPSAKQIIMMLPFFSYKNGQGMSTIDVKKQLERDQIHSSGFDGGICRFISNKRIKYNVPCFKYFNQAYKILQKQGYSAGFWQGGNGLQNYYKFM